MKKKSLLVFLLAMASTAALGAAGCNHEHSWTLKHNDDLHWNECECGAQSDSAVHVDLKNNETSETSPDGKCDVCGADMPVWQYDDNNHWQLVSGNKSNIGGHVDLVNNDTHEEGMDGKCDSCGKLFPVSVTFVIGHGKDPIVREVGFGTCAVSETPKLSGYVFDGWYADKNCKTAFDFSTAITSEISVYAKWTASTVAGSNEEHPLALEFESNSVTAAFGDLEKLYFEYTAANDGRYYLMLNSGVSRNCSFTTSLDDDETYTGNERKNFDLREGETVIVEVACGDGVDSAAKVGVYVGAVTNEDITDDWKSGDYSDGQNVLALDLAAKTAKWNGFEAVGFNYVGGIIDQLTFTITSPLNGKFTVTRKDNALHVVCNNPQFLSEAADFSAVVYPDPIDIAKLSGIYELSESKLDHPIGGKVVRLCVYESGNAYLLSNADDISFYRGYYIEYKTKTNTLEFGNFKVTPNLDKQGNVVSLNVTGPAYGEGTVTQVFTRTGNSGDEIPEFFAELADGTTYAGANYYFKAVGEYTTFGGTDYRIRLYSYTESEHSYTVKVKNDSYKVVIEGEGESAVIKWYDTEDTLLDTLTKYAITKNYAGTASEDITLAETDFKVDLYHLTVAKEGWFKFTTEQALEFYVIEEGYDYFNVSELKPFDASDSVYLNAGTVIAVSKAKIAEGSNVEFSVAPSGPAAGRTAEHPYEIEGFENINIASVEGGTQYYAEYTLPRAGKYYVTIYNTVESETESGVKDVQYFYMFYYTLNGDSGHGWDPTGGWGSWTGGLSSTVHSATIDLTEDDLTLKIVFSHQFGAENVVVKVEEDYSDAQEFGSSTSGKITESGTYKGETDNPYTTLKLKSASEFTIIVDGETYALKEIELNSDQINKGVRLTIASGAEVSYEYAYALGAQQNPVKTDKLGYTGVLVLPEGVRTYVTVTAPAGVGYLITLADDGYCYFVNETRYDYNKPYSLAKGESVTIAISYADINSDDAQNNGTTGVVLNYDYTVNAQTINFTPIPLGSVIINFANGSSVTNGNFKLKDTLESSVIITSAKPFKVNYPDGTSGEPELSNGSYIYTLPATEEDMYFNVTAEQSADLVFAISYELGSKGNPYVVTLKDGVSFTSDKVKPGATVYYSLPVGTYSYKTDAYNYSLLLNDTRLTGSTFTVSEGDLISFAISAYVSETTVAFNMLVPKDLQSDYKLGEDKVTISANKVTVGDKEYILSSISGNVYTFTYENGETKESVKITVDGDNVLYNDTPLEADGIPAELCGTWEGSFTVPMQLDITLTISSNGDVSYVTDDGWGNVDSYESTLNLVGDSYQFKYKGYYGGEQTCTITFEDGRVMFSDSGAFGTITLTKK